MSAPTRLLNSNRNPAARALLEVALADRSGPGSARRTAKALGLSAGALATVSAASGVASATSGAVVISASALAASSAAPSLLVTATQWLALGLVGGASVVGGASFVTSRTTPVAPATATSSLRPASALAPRAASRPVAPTAAQAPAASAAPSAAFTRTAPSGSALDRAPSAVPESVSASGRLAREVALIDDARRALLAGHAQRALAVLDAYTALDTTGTLAREARVLRIEALLAAGQRALALPLAARYSSEFPSDPHAQKLRALLAEAEDATR